MQDIVVLSARHNGLKIYIFAVLSTISECTLPVTCLFWDSMMCYASSSLMNPLSFIFDHMERLWSGINFHFVDVLKCTLWCLCEDVITQWCIAKMSPIVKGWWMHLETHSEGAAYSRGHLNKLQQEALDSNSASLTFDSLTQTSYITTLQILSSCLYQMVHISLWDLN